MCFGSSIAAELPRSLSPEPSLGVPSPASSRGLPCPGTARFPPSILLAGSVQEEHSWVQRKHQVNKSVQRHTHVQRLSVSGAISANPSEKCIPQNPHYSSIHWMRNFHCFPTWAAKITWMLNIRPVSKPVKPWWCRLPLTHNLCYTTSTK